VLPTVGVVPLDLLANERISTGAPLTHPNHRPPPTTHSHHVCCQLWVVLGGLGGAGHAIVSARHFKLNSPQTKWPRLLDTAHPCPLDPAPGLPHPPILAIIITIICSS